MFNSVTVVGAFTFLPIVFIYPPCLVCEIEDHVAFHFV